MHDLGLAGFLCVATLGLISGVASLLVLRSASKTGQLRRAANLVVAHLFEMKLYADEPLILLRAQRDLFAANGRMLLQLLVPSLILLIPVTLMIMLAEPFFGNVALLPGETALLTVRLSDLKQDAQLVIPAPINSALKIDAPPVHISWEREVVWRIRATKAVAGYLNIASGGKTVGKRITSAVGLAWAPMHRNRYLPSDEPPFFGTNIESIDVGYPAATVFRLHWLVVFSVSSLIGAAAAATKS